MLNMAMTLIAWIYVYQMKTDDHLSAMFLMNGNSTTGNQYKDGIRDDRPGHGVVFDVVARSLRLPPFGTTLAAHVIDLLKSQEISEEKIIYEYLPGLVTAYGGFGCIAFFYRKAPLLLHQFYVLSNCSLVSLFYLRSFPSHTAWFVLWNVALWDIFAVLAPIGPLRKVQEKAGDYSQDVLRFLMFTADAKSMPNAGEEEESSEEGSLESETVAEALQQQQNEAVMTSSFSLTEESEDGIVPGVEQPLLRRRVRQTAGTEQLEMVNDIPEKKGRVGNSKMKAQRRIGKDKKSDLSSEDEVAVELEMNENGDDSNSSGDENSFDDTEAPRLDLQKNVVESSSCSSSTSSSSLSSSSSANYSSSNSSDLTTTKADEKAVGNIKNNIAAEWEIKILPVYYLKNKIVILINKPLEFREE
ncbi:hypothetical protein KIN20_033913 [Parelaphostrongylus tenuis]|uniref:Uncharacterized protein n=1 Tax=Parelaphostrongylus tenuis TaxID=148309 RepID=A0AAD5R9K0_PARTN|nr:hypothetical protein KIN20_033913 [Parelaphostrongylus tenuis]